MKLVIYPSVEERRLYLIRDAAGRMQVVNAADSEEAMAAMADADAFFGKITPELLAGAGQLRWVQAPTASLEHYVFSGLMEHPCTLTNMRGLFSDVIADQVMGYVVCFARNLHIYVRRQMERRWEAVGGESGRSTFLTGPGVVTSLDRSHMHLADQTLGVVGLGAIGSEVQRRAMAFGMRVLAVDPRNPAAWPMERLGDLLGASDFVVIAAPHTPRTERMFRGPQLAQMKPSAYLINVGRGAIVDLADLVWALENKTIGGAALDVFEHEPLPADHPLWGHENVIITPHVAGYSPRIAERHLAVLLDNIRRFAKGQPLTNVVNKAEWF